MQHKFYGFLDEEDDDDEPDVVPEGPPALFKVSDADGSLDMEAVKEGDISQGDLQSQVCVYMLYMYVWFKKHLVR